MLCYERRAKQRQMTDLCRRGGLIGAGVERVDSSYMVSLVPHP